MLLSGVQTDDKHERRIKKTLSPQWVPHNKLYWINCYEGLLINGSKQRKNLKNSNRPDNNSHEMQDKIIPATSWNLWKIDRLLLHPSLWSIFYTVSEWTHPNLKRNWSILNCTKYSWFYLWCLLPKVKRKHVYLLAEIDDDNLWKIRKILLLYGWRAAEGGQ